jgi:hypothetical protein
MSENDMIRDALLEMAAEPDREARLRAQHAVAELVSPRSRKSLRWRSGLAAVLLIGVALSPPGQAVAERVGDLVAGPDDSEGITAPTGELIQANERGIFVDGEKLEQLSADQPGARDSADSGGGFVVIEGQPSASRVAECRDGTSPADDLTCRALVAVFEGRLEPGRYSREQLQALP